MPRSTRIMSWRQRRQRRSGRTGRFLLRVFAVVLAFFFLVGFTILFGSVSTVAAVYDYFTIDLPDFMEIERLGQDVDTTFETTKIDAWDRGTDAERELVLIYEVIDPLG